MTGRVSRKNKEKKANRENSVKKRDQTGKKKTVQKTDSSVAESRTRFICTCKQFLDRCITCSDTHDLKISFVISKQFFSAIDAV